MKKKKRNLRTYLVVEATQADLTGPVVIASHPSCFPFCVLLVEGRDGEARKGQGHAKLKLNISIFEQTQTQTVAQISHATCYALGELQQMNPNPGQYGKPDAFFCTSQQPES
jgi:hypothetical protein